MMLSILPFGARSLQSGITLPVAQPLMKRNGAQVGKIALFKSCFAFGVFCRVWWLAFFQNRNESSILRWNQIANTARLKIGHGIFNHVALWRLGLLLLRFRRIFDE